MGRYYRVALKDKSEKNIQRVNEILEQEFKAPVQTFPDGFKDTIIISKKYLKDEFNHVKGHENYEQFAFSHKIKQENLTLKWYADWVEWFMKAGYSEQFKISCINDVYQANRVLALSEMVDSDKYQDLFIIDNSKSFVNYETKELVYSYCKHLL